MKFLSIFVLLALISCKQTHSKDIQELKVYGGEKTDDYLFTALLLNSDYGSFCTGSFINERTVITAGHCFPDKSNLSNFGLIRHTTKNGNVKIIDDGKDAFVPAENIYIAEKVPDNKTLPLGDDLAVVTFKKSISKEFVSFSSHTPRAGDDIEFVGYGKTNEDKETASGKNLGRNKIVSVGPKIYIEALSPDKQNVTGVGDSGGPLLYNGELIGVVSAGSPVKAGSLFTNLRSESACKFLKKTLNNLKINFADNCEAF